MAGDETAVRWAVVILGTSIPVVVDFTSSIAEGSGVEPSVLMATCEKELIVKSNKKLSKNGSTLFLWLINVPL